MDQERAEVELTIQIGMETDDDAVAVVHREARRATIEALVRGVGLPVYVHETQWCSGAMRVTVRRPHLPPVVTADQAQMPPPKDATAARPTPEALDMAPERAREITVACVANAMSRNIPGATYQPLPRVSLADMLLANRLCAEDKGYGGMTVDPRGLAAAYAFEQFGQDAERLLNAVGLTSEPDEDEDLDTE